MLALFGPLPLLALATDPLALSVGVVLGLVAVAAMGWAATPGARTALADPGRPCARRGRPAAVAGDGDLGGALDRRGVLPTAAVGKENAVVAAILPGAVFATAFAVVKLGHRVLG